MTHMDYSRFGMWQVPLTCFLWTSRLLSIFLAPNEAWLWSFPNMAVMQHSQMVIVTIPDDAVAGNGSWYWSKNKFRTCCILDINSSIPFHLTHYPILQMQDNVLIVSANVVWMQRQKSIVNGTKLQVQSGRCSVNYHKMNYSFICDIWTLGVLSEV